MAKSFEYDKIIDLLRNTLQLHIIELPPDDMSGKGNIVVITDSDNGEHIIIPYLSE